MSESTRTVSSTSARFPTTSSAIASEVVKVGQKVQVTVMEVDLQRNRIALSMKSKPDFEPRQNRGSSSPAGNDRRPPQRRDNRPQQQPVGNDWFSQAMGEAKKH